MNCVPVNALSVSELIAPLAPIFTSVPLLTKAVVVVDRRRAAFDVRRRSRALLNRRAVCRECWPSRSARARRVPEALTVFPGPRLSAPPRGLHTGGEAAGSSRPKRSLEASGAFDVNAGRAG